MPIYDYKASEGHPGCEHCRDGFSHFQKMSDAALTACPKCGGPVSKQLAAVGLSLPKTASTLKNLGFTKLVKREEGVYENITRTGDEARYMIRDKPETMPNIKGKIAD